MAEMKIDFTKAVKDTAERALDEYQYKGMTIREWADKITAGEYQPVKHGEWREENTRPSSPKFICSNCGGVGYNRPLGAPKHKAPKKCVLNYCPNCGARMDGGESND